MFAIISILLIASATALNLPPTSISAPVSLDFYYQVADGDTLQTFTNKISNIQPALGFQDKKYLEQLVEGIASHFKGQNVTPYKFPQILKINRQLGVLRVIQITVTAQEKTRTIMITGKYVEVNQNIPKVFNVTKVCHKGEKRKYGLLGQRKEVCRDVSVERGLNSAELAQVNKALMDMVPQAQTKLN